MPRGQNISSRACDACRLRKIRCQPSDRDQDQFVPPPCQACSGASIPCTYDLPVKRRGPLAKRRDASATSPTLSIGPNNAPSILDQGLLEPRLHKFCSQAVVDAILDDYLELVYPSFPIVHCPTFTADRLAARHMHDEVFEALVLAICAIVVSILPMKLHDYHAIDSDFDFANRNQFVECVHALIIRSRPPDYYDNLSQEKWAISYLLAAGHGFSGQAIRSKIAWAEAEAIVLQMGFHRKGFYDGLDNIQAQLYKKSFWLMFAGYAQLRPNEVGWDTLIDRCAFQTADAALLVPIEVDDEFITADGIAAQPTFMPALTVAFNALRKVENCLVSIVRDYSVPILTSTHEATSSADVLGTCSCGSAIKLASSEEVLLARLRQLRYVLDYLPPELSLWPDRQTEPQSPISNTRRCHQYEIVRADLHVAHLWAQHLLLERLTFLCQSDPDRCSSHVDLEQIWRMKEEVCRQLLHLLRSISPKHLQANGSPLGFKVRQVVSGLLDCPFEEGHQAYHRATMYVQDFTGILAQLDKDWEPYSIRQLTSPSPSATSQVHHPTPTIWPDSEKP